MWGSVEPAVREFTNHYSIILNNRAPCSWVSQIQINSKSFPDVARCIQHETFMCSCNDLWRWVLFKQKGGTGGMGECTQRLQTEWLSLCSALGVPWLALSGPLLSSYARMGWENSPLILHGAISGGDAFFPVWMSTCPAASHYYLYCKLVNG